MGWKHVPEDSEDCIVWREGSSVIYYISYCNSGWKRERKACQKSSKINEKSIENRSEIHPKWGPRGYLEHLGTLPRDQEASGSIFDRFWAPFWDPVGAMLGSKIVKKSIWSDSKSLPKRNTLFDGFQYRLFIDVGSILDLFLESFWIRFGDRRHVHVNDATPDVFQICFDDSRTSSLQ